MKPVPRAPRFFWGVGLFEHVSRWQNSVDIKMCHMESVFYGLKFHFWWVWALGDNVNEISIWRQFFSRGSFFEYFHFSWSFFGFSKNLVIFVNFNFKVLENAFISTHKFFKNFCFYFRTFKVLYFSNPPKSFLETHTIFKLFCFKMSFI